MKKIYIPLNNIVRKYNFRPIMKGKVRFKQEF